ncbi:hypothetical protein KJ596_02570 [Patescibacteria group bacterium]|nr:hypothetical protein [Patescibacteria group bacterium]MBU1868675.1 hypothetical protein [Patescibacteria group bacterium]
MSKLAALWLILGLIAGALITAVTDNQELGIAAGGGLALLGLGLVLGLKAAIDEGISLGFEDRGFHHLRQGRKLRRVLILAGCILAIAGIWLVIFSGFF